MSLRPSAAGVERKKWGEHNRERQEGDGDRVKIKMNVTQQQSLCVNVGLFLESYHYITLNDSVT